MKQVEEYLADFIDYCDTKDANSAWNDLRARILSIAKKTLGISKGSKLKTDKDTSWWSSEVKQALAEKKSSFKKWQESKADLDKTQYMIAKRAAKRAVAIAKASSKNALISRLQNAETDEEIQNGQTTF
ncbi:unnamed protein product [Leptidea sinapis]|uniref:Uncharacterized protein n=1 Tax=Leptidea sinapis TaxID=189913 RepID=A0A5E4Q1N7_9NEOP|nr:unnamed protein product [Leptidea sinapis]